MAGSPWLCLGLGLCLVLGASGASAQELRPYTVVGDAIPVSLTGAPGDAAKGRAIVGARQVGLCRHLAAALHVHAKAGDPLARMLGAERPAGLPEPEAPHPGWAVACGLLAAPTDL